MRRLAKQTQFCQVLPGEKEERKRSVTFAWIAKVPTAASKATAGGTYGSRYGKERRAQWCRLLLLSLCFSARALLHQLELELNGGSGSCWL